MIGTIDMNDTHSEEECGICKAPTSRVLCDGCEAKWGAQLDALAAQIACEPARMVGNELSVAA